MGGATMSRLRTLLKNPYVVVMPVVVLMAVIWQQFIITAPSRHTADITTMILQRIHPEKIYTALFPEPMQPGGRTMAAVDPIVVSKRDVNVLDLMQQPNATVADSPVAISSALNIEPGNSYLFKASYVSSAYFDLIQRTNYLDGSFIQDSVKRYAANEDGGVVSHLFTTDTQAESVQFFRNSSNRTAQVKVNGAYLEPNPKDVLSRPVLDRGDNIMPPLTPELIALNGQPSGWSTFKYGDNNETFTYVTDDHKPYLRTTLSNYRNGESKWQYAPVEVRGGQALAFEVAYRSDAVTSVVAEYELSSGERKFETIVDLYPVQTWTTYTGDFEVPVDALNVVATVVLKSNGTLETRQYALYDITKPGDIMWENPTISLTFDDGWVSAANSVAPTLNRYGYKGTFYLNPSSIDTPGFMTSAQVQQLVDQGHEVASHGYEHIDATTLQSDGVDYQLGYANDYFNSVHSQTRSNLATPFGANDARIRFYANKYYASLRGTEAGINTKQNIDRYNLRVLYVGSSTPIQRLNDAIRQTKDKRGWLIVVYHRIEPESKLETVLSKEKFDQHIEAVRLSGIEVKTVDARLQDINASDSITVSKQSKE